MIRICFIVYFFSVSLVAADTSQFHGVFNSPACSQKIAHAELKRDAAYRERAVARGLTGPAVEEFIRRSARNRVLAATMMLAVDEAKMLLGIVRMEGIARTMRTDLEKDARGIADYEAQARRAAMGYRRAGGVHNDHEVKLQDAYPFGFSILLNRPPVGDYEEREFDELMFLRTGLTVFRSAVSRVFVSLPADRRIEEFSDEVLNRSREDAHSKGNDLWAAAEHLIFKDQIEELKEEIEVAAISPRDFDALAESLLEREDIPLPVRQEIATQLDFDAKYRFKKDAFFKVYLQRVENYFTSF